MEDNKNKLMLINKNLKILQEMYSLNSNYNLEEYVMNLVDIKIEYLEKGFNKIKINKKNLYFPSIFEIRKNSLEEEALLVYHFLIKLASELKNKEINFKNEKLSKFINKHGTWNSYKNVIINKTELAFIEEYVSFR